MRSTFKFETELCAWCYKEHQVQKMVFLGHHNVGQGEFSGWYCLECVEEALREIKDMLKGKEK